MTAPRVSYRCSHCGSANVTTDAVTRWNDTTQVWEISCLFDNSDCDDCGGETRLEEIPLDEVTA